MSHPQPEDPLDLPVFRVIAGEGKAAPQPIRERKVATHALAGRIDQPPRVESFSQVSNGHEIPALPLRATPLGPSPQLNLPAALPLAGDPSAATTPPRRRATEPGVPMDWQQVAMFRSQASERLTAALGDERGRDLAAEKEIAQSIVRELLQAEAAERLSNGQTPWSLDEQAAVAQAVLNALFGLGRLQPLVDDDRVENIIIAGAANVWLELTDGTLVSGPPVADSDEELLDFLAFVASRSEVNARSFSSTNPRLHMRLDGGSRLAAAAWVTAYPSVVIRRHRLRQVTLDDLVERDMLSPVQSSFLRAAIRARKSVVVAGPQGGGKTTLVRALCSSGINPWEAIGTFETEFELHLHELTDVHPIVHAWEARPGSGEIGPDGRQAGEFTLDEALYDSFRFNLSRQIVGEVRGREVWAMIKAMESGAGSISTTHAENAEGALRKLVTCAMEAGPHVTKELATSKLAETVDIIVQVQLETIPLGDDQWRRSRWVSEILAVSPGESAKGYATTHVFKPNPNGGPAIPGILPDELRSLEKHGFDLDSYVSQYGDTERTAP